MNQELVTEAPNLCAADLTLAKNMADLLHRHYPGHLWAVTCEEGVATVRNLYLSGNWGFVIKVGDVYSMSDFDRKIVRAGGELLERFKMSRGKFRDDQYSDIKTDFAGNLIADRG
jgi:hypothetical protein